MGAKVKSYQVVPELAANQVPVPSLHLIVIIIRCIYVCCMLRWNDGRPCIGE